MKEKLPPGAFFLRFYGRRSLRIFPLYYFFLFSVALAATLWARSPNYQSVPQVEDFWIQLPWLLTYSFNFYHASVYYHLSEWTSHFWSLCVEEQFYLLWPLLIFLIPKRNLKSGFLILILIGPVIRSIVAVAAFLPVHPSIHHLVGMVVYVLPFSYVDAFSIGAWFALFGKGTSLLKIGALFLIIACSGLMSFYLDHGFVDWWALGYVFPLESGFQMIWAYSLWALLFGQIILAIKGKIFFPRLVENQVLESLGKISYGLYIYHFPIIWFCAFSFPDLSKAWQMILSFFITVAISYLSFYGFEKRFLNLKDRFFPIKER